MFLTCKKYCTKSLWHQLIKYGSYS